MLKRRVGVFGGGQLARMMGQEARRLGVELHVLDPNPACCGGAIAHRHIVSGLDDVQAAERLAMGVDVVTVDTEHVPTASLAAAAKHADVFPGANALARIQDRLAQRQLLAELGVPQTPWAQASDAAALDGGAVSFPAI